MHLRSIQKTKSNLEKSLECNKSVSTDQTILTSMIQKYDTLEACARVASTVTRLLSPMLSETIPAKNEKFQMYDVSETRSWKPCVLNELVTKSYEQRLKDSGEDTSIVPAVLDMVKKYLVSPNAPTLEKNGDISTKKQVLQACGQREPIPIHLLFSMLKGLEKIGEGIFGEVFLGYNPGWNSENRPRTSNVPRAFKIVPIEGSKLVNEEVQKKFKDILPEILISQ